MKDVVDIDIASQAGRRLGEFLYRLRESREHQPGSADERDLIEDHAGDLAFVAMDERYTFAWLILLQLDRPAMCRIVDALIEGMQPMAPVPSFRDVMADAEDWAASIPDEARRAFFFALWSEMGRKTQGAALAEIIRQMDDQRLQKTIQFAQREQKTRQNEGSK